MSLKIAEFIRARLVEQASAQRVMTRRRVAKRSVRSLRTRGGLQIRLSDDKNQPEITIDVPGGVRLALRRLAKRVELRDADAMRSGSSQAKSRSGRQGCSGFLPPR